MTLRIEEVTEASPGLVVALARLVPQLSSSVAPPGTTELEEMIACPTTSLLMARYDPGLHGRPAVVGALTLVVFRVPTGMRAWIEDVVVDESARGRGVGRALTEEALQRAARAGARTVDLTSRPSREAANRLYRRLGFARRETNVYRYEQPD